MKVLERRYEHGEAVAKPASWQGREIEVKIRKKEGWEKTKWGFEVGN